LQLNQCCSVTKASISAFLYSSLTISIPFGADVSQVTGVNVGYRHDIIGVNMLLYKSAGCTLTDRYLYTVNILSDKSSDSTPVYTVNVLTDKSANFTPADTGICIV